MVNFNTMKHRIYSHGQLRFMDINWQTKSLEWTGMVERVEGWRDEQQQRQHWFILMAFVISQICCYSWDRTGPGQVIYCITGHCFSRSVQVCGGVWGMNFHDNDQWLWSLALKGEDLTLLRCSCGSCHFFTFPYQFCSRLQ